MNDATHSMAAMLADSATSFAARHYDFARRTQRLEEDLGAGSPIWREFAELGWLACLVPEECQGLGASALEMAALMQVFGKALLVEPVLSSAVLATKVLDATGGPTSAALLARLASGDCQSAVAYLESGTRADVAHVSTQYATGPDGSTWLNGAKAIVLGAPTADCLIVSARNPADGRLELVLVETDAPGVTMIAYRTIDGLEAADVTFTDVRLSPDARLTTDLDGRAALSLALDWAAMAACAQLVGIVDEVIRISAEYARTRQQFGQPIGRFQSIKHLLAEMATQALLARAMLARGTDALHQEDGARREEAVSAAKNCIGRAADFVTANGIQIHGGIGMTEEFIVGHYYKRSLVLSELFGSTAFHRDRFAERTRAASNSLSRHQSGYSDAV